MEHSSKKSKKIAENEKSLITGVSETESNEDSLLDESLIESYLDMYNDDLRKQIQKVFTKLTGSPKYILADQEKIEKIKALEKIYPNMKDVIDYIVLNCKASALRCNQDISFRPIILVGGPGCGKTAFCSDLSQIVMGKPPIKIDLGNNVANFSLSGSAPEFKQARHGLIIESMFSNGDHHPLKNPIIQFDELDKIKKEDTFSIESIFYSILEKCNSKRFFDNYIGMNIDASGINYIFTANSLDNISGPIINRLKIFKIADYTHEQLKDCVINNFYENWLENNKMKREYLPASLSDEIKERILRYSNDDPRSIEDSIIRVLNETLSFETDSDHPVALFSPEELEMGWEKFCGKRKELPKKKQEFYDPVVFLEQYEAS
ncbi:AAA family ATPase [Treponema ruminis]|uniref:ATP-dependent Lon protease n=1 Tax=Treponema ruminis TaxID=744515 RepID=A0A7W8GAL9_9SPIR|nr:AAA family ATPase [Treponema ruminis]MBB5226784.1 ATP-dependent Lon protease [Treponema ruminis]QSI01993.1 AAA family ATPase [Treponema ruminis]